MGLFNRTAKRYDGPVVRATPKRHPGATGYFATKKDGSPDYRRALRWVFDPEHERGGYFEEA